MIVFLDISVFETCADIFTSTFSCVAVTQLFGWRMFQAQKKTYRREKKKAAKELLSTLKDPSVILIADWLKVRGSLKGWTKLWCVLKPGLLLLYKSLKQKVGSLLS